MYKKILLGHVDVDSGQLMLIDPCYLKHWNHGDSSWIHEDMDLKKLETNSHWEMVSKTTLNKGSGEVCNGVAFKTAYGDASCPVFAIVEGKKILHVWVELTNTTLEKALSDIE